MNHALREINPDDVLGTSADDFAFPDHELVRERLRLALASKGVNADGSALDEAIESLTRDRHSFNPQKKSLAYKLGGIYVNRVRIARKTIRAALISGISLATVSTLIFAGMSAYRIFDERSAEKEVERLYSQSETLKNAASALTSQVDAVNSFNAEEKHALSSNISEAYMHIGQWQPFFETYTENGKATRHVTTGNRVQAKQQAKGIESAIKRASLSITKAQQITTNRINIDGSLNNLEKLISEIRQADPPPNILADAESIYHEGLAMAASGQGDKSVEYGNQLRQLTDDFTDITALLPVAKTLYASITTKAGEDKAVDLANLIGQDAEKYASDRNITNLKLAVAKLTGLDNAMQEYQVRIIGGVYGEVHKTKKIEYFLRVQAVSKDGTVLPVLVFNKATDSWDVVDQWAETSKPAFLGTFNRDNALTYAHQTGNRKVC